MDTGAIKTINLKRVLTIILAVFVTLAVVVGGYFLYKYLFPTNKELFVQAHINSIKYAEEKGEIERFSNNTNISFSAEGSFSSNEITDAISTLSVTTSSVKTGDDNEKYDILVSFMGNEIISSNLVKKDDVEVLTIPQLADESLGADSYSDVLSLLLGSEKSEDVEIFDNVDEDRLEDYIYKYSKKLYDNVPEGDFTSSNDGNAKTITLNTDLNRTLYETLTEMKNDIGLRDFIYEQMKIVGANINKKVSFTGQLITIPEKNEFDEEYVKSIDEFIKNIENSRLIVKSKIDSKRRLTEENISILNNEKEQYSVIYSDEKFVATSYKNDTVSFKIDSQKAKDGTQTKQKSQLFFDVTDFTQGKSETPKMLIMTIESVTDENVTESIVLPENYRDIRSMSAEEKTKVTQKASEGFVALITSLTMGLMS